eukprot:TRINITY_DN6935_c1_g1_i1.p1 TRINITY_DN6935_c1_g1~~TRINITY_DN6935_c1_g1_i1.p1  ORF type:complete len:257 (+),score=70.17 TRINITY_DN6935_c1_g1_i1:41-772(+)
MSKSSSSLRNGTRSTQNLAGPQGMPPTLASVEDLRKMIEETKAEVRAIKAVESKTKWDMKREERSHKVAEAAAETAEIRDWRWQQADEMKAMVEANTREQKVKETKEAKAYIDFKKEVKTRTREEELAYQQQVYAEHLEDSNWDKEKLRQDFLEEQALVKEKIENVQHLREERQIAYVREKQEQEQDRTLEQQLEYAKIARDLELEKARLLESLDFQRNCQKATPLAVASSINGQGETRSRRS